MPDLLKFGTSSISSLMLKLGLFVKRGAFNIENTESTLSKLSSSFEIASILFKLCLLSKLEFGV